MLVDPATLAEARAGKRQALTRLLAMHYPQVWRIATNLTGSRELGRKISARIMRRSLLAADGWEHEEAPTRWFRHHTVLATREATLAASPRPDVLLEGVAEDAGYTAFVRAVRGLPQQQREAFLLNHGEDFDLRQIGIAMDCSVEAAGVHLRHATLSLQAIAGDGFGRFVQAARLSYAASAPDESLSLPYARRLVSTGFSSRLAVVLGWLLLIVLLTGLAYGLWWIWPRIIL